MISLQKRFDSENDELVADHIDRTIQQHNQTLTTATTEQLLKQEIEKIEKFCQDLEDEMKTHQHINILQHDFTVLDIRAGVMISLLLRINIDLIKGNSIVRFRTYTSGKE